MLIDLELKAYGTYSLRRTKVAMLYKKTGNLRAYQLLLGHRKLESTVRGVVRLSLACWQEGAKRPKQPPLPRCGGGLRPRLVSFGPQDAQAASADQVRLEVKGVVDCGMGGQETLG